MNREYYGKLNVKSLDPEVYRIWLTRNDELDELPCVDIEEAVDYGPALEARSLLQQIFANIKLNEREVHVFKLRIFEQYTLEETAQELGVTRERIRQMEGKIYRKMIRGFRLIDERVLRKTLELKLQVVS